MSNFKTTVTKMLIPLFNSSSVYFFKTLSLVLSLHQPFVSLKTWLGAFFPRCFHYPPLILNQLKKEAENISTETLCQKNKTLTSGAKVQNSQFSNGQQLLYLITDTHAFYVVPKRACRVNIRVFFIWLLGPIAIWSAFPEDGVNEKKTCRKRCLPPIAKRLFQRFKSACCWSATGPMRIGKC